MRSDFKSDRAETTLNLINLKNLCSKRGQHPFNLCNPWSFQFICKDTKSYRGVASFSAFFSKKHYFLYL